jgi:Mn2+/Fe2+ NRAMP family transporter
MKALFWAGLINGALAPFLLLGVWMVASDPQIMRGQTSPRLPAIGAIATILVMLGATGMMLFHSR